MSISRDERDAADMWALEHEDEDVGTMRVVSDDYRKSTRKNLSKNSQNLGDQETSMNREMHANLGEVTLPDEFRKKKGVPQFEQAWNLYRLPMGLAISAVGRVQDLLTAGAPKTPADIPKSEAKKMYADTSEEQKSYHEWAKETGDLDESMDSLVTASRALTAAHKLWHAAKVKLDRRVAEKKLSAKQDEMDKLEAPAKTISSIYDFVTSLKDGLTGDPTGSLDAVGDLDNVGRKHQIELSGSQRAMLAMMGDADAWKQLRQDIIDLEDQIANAGLVAESFEIGAAKDSLDADTEGAVTKAAKLNAHRMDARKDSALFARDLSGGKIDNDLKMVPMMAEAYQELRIFATKADELSGPVFNYMKKLGAVDDDYDGRRDAAIHAGEMNDDTYVLHRVYRDAYTMKEFQEQELPGWLEVAASWRDYFKAGERGTKEELDKYAAARDR